MYNINNQIVKLIIPHNTPRSKGIRDFIKSYLLNERNDELQQSVSRKAEEIGGAHLHACHTVL